MFDLNCATEMIEKIDENLKYWVGKRIDDRCGNLSYFNVFVNELNNRGFHAYISEGAIWIDSPFIKRK